jgi:anti-sigma factor RsiW
MAENKKDHRLEDALAYQQGFLSPEKRAEFEEHLKGCAACLATLERVKVFLPNLQQALTPKLRSTDALLATARAEARERQLRRERTASRRLGSRARAALLVAATAAAGGTIFTIARPLFEVVETGGAHSPHRPAPDAGPDGGGVDVGGAPGTEESR